MRKKVYAAFSLAFCILCSINLWRNITSLTPDLQQWENIYKQEKPVGCHIYRNYSLPGIYNYSIAVLEAETKFTILASQLHMHCPDVKRYGLPGDGGWDVCVSDQYALKNNCLVYSFGIFYDFSFDNAIIKNHQCTVKSFDPSMNRNQFRKIPPGSSANMSEKLTFYKIGLSSINGTQNGWTVKTLGAILQDQKDTFKIIDILKIDIEYNEWHSLNQTFKEGSLKHVKQLIMEIHTPECMSKYFKVPVTSSELYIQMYNVLRELELLGFRKYFIHHNPTCKRKSRATGKDIETCFELSYLNINYLK